MDAFPVGSLVRFREVLEPGDETARFTVVEDRGDRLLVADASGRDWGIVPTYCYSVDFFAAA